VLPAVPMSKWYPPAWTSPGSNVRVSEPRMAPSVAALEISAAALTAARCWGSSPGRRRAARIFSMENGIPVRSEQARAVRRI
jgi:hypothetical protein